MKDASELSGDPETPPSHWLPQHVAPAYDALIADPSRGLSTDDVRALLEIEHQRAIFRATIARGDAQLDRGEGAELTDKLVSPLTQVPPKNMHRDKSTDPDVLP